MPPTFKSHQGRLIFEFHHPRGLGLPIFIQIVMIVAFGMPSIACFLFTLQELPQHPWLVLVYLVSLFPMAVLYLLARFMGRYALKVYENGDLEVTFPFSKKILSSGSVSKITSDSRYVAATKSTMTWIRFVSHEGQILLSLAGSVFAKQVFDEFVAAAKSANPQLRSEL